MIDQQWVVVRNWNRFQHYTDRTPPWIKLYTAELLHDPDWERLSAGSRGTLVTIWCEYALHKGRLPLEVVRKSLGRSYKVAFVEALVHAGYIDVVASKPLALARARVRSREERTNRSLTRAVSSQERAREQDDDEPARARSEEEQHAVDVARALAESDEPPADPEALKRIEELTSRMGWNHGEQSWPDYENEDELPF